MALLIDSSIFIAAERGHLDFADFLTTHSQEEMVMSAITVSELLHGVHRATPSRRGTREIFVERLLATMAVLPFDTPTARIHAGLWAEIAAKGITIGAHDLLIAATALSAGAQIATRDQRSFTKIPGLSVLHV